MGFFFALSLLLIVRCYEGKNWARWANLAYLALGWLLGIQDIGQHIQVSPLAGILESSIVVMEVAACWLLFTGIGNHWFKELDRIRRAA